MSGIWQEPTARGPVPFQIMRQREARATKTDRNQSEWFTSLQIQRGRQSGGLLGRWTQMVM